MLFESSIDSLKVTRSESVTELNSGLKNLPHHLHKAAVSHLKSEDNFVTAQQKPYEIGKYKYIIIIYNTITCSIYYISIL
jgi:hypothetical protein